MYLCVTITRTTIDAKESSGHFTKTEYRAIRTQPTREH